VFKPCSCILSTVTSRPTRLYTGYMFETESNGRASRPILSICSTYISFSSLKSLQIIIIINNTQDDVFVEFEGQKYQIKYMLHTCLKNY